MFCCMVYYKPFIFESDLCFCESKSWQNFDTSILIAKEMGKRDAKICHCRHICYAKNENCNITNIIKSAQSDQRLCCSMIG